MAGKIRWETVDKASITCAFFYKLRLDITSRTRGKRKHVFCSYPLITQSLAIVLAWTLTPALYLRSTPELSGRDCQARLT